MQLYLTNWRELVHRYVIRCIDKLRRVIVDILHVDRYGQMRRDLRKNGET